MESVDGAGNAPQVVSAKAVGRRVFELFWQHSFPYTSSRASIRLRHSTLRNDLVTAITQVRETLGPTRSGMTLDQARRLDRPPWTLSNARSSPRSSAMPVPKLQRYGPRRGEVDQFLYDFDWPDEVPEGRVWRDDFDDGLRLQAGLGVALIRLAGVLRPVIQQRWAAFVAARSRNELGDVAFLDEFLFGVNRVSLDRVREPLFSLQGGQCFYCATAARLSGVDVDHFLPWVRHPDNGIDNLVAVDRSCNNNNNKRDAVAALSHLEIWLERVDLQALVDGWARRSAPHAGRRASDLPHPAQRHPTVAGHQLVRHR